MKIPRDLHGADLARRLEIYGYRVTRQSGSHIRLTRSADGGQQHLTVPAHKPLKVGTLRQILKDDASQSGSSLETIVQSIAG